MESREKSRDFVGKLVAPVKTIPRLAFEIVFKDDEFLGDSLSLKFRVQNLRMQFLSRRYMFRTPQLLWSGPPRSEHVDEVDRSGKVLQDEALVLQVHDLVPRLRVRTQMNNIE